MAHWGSSSRSVLESLPGQSITALNVDLDGLPTERTLVMSLDFAADCFVLKATISVGRSTHREILRATATNFDPLGCLAPVLIVAKLILQKICKAKVEWDVALDKDLAALGRLPCGRQRPPHSALLLFITLSRRFNRFDYVFRCLGESVWSCWISPL